MTKCSINHNNGRYPDEEEIKSPLITTNDTQNEVHIISTTLRKGGRNFHLLKLRSPNNRLNKKATNNYFDRTHHEGSFMGSQFPDLEQMANTRMSEENGNFEVTNQIGSELKIFKNAIRNADPINFDTKFDRFADLITKKMEATQNKYENKIIEVKKQLSNKIDECHKLKNKISILEAAKNDSKIQINNEEKKDFNKKILELQEENHSLTNEIGEFKGKSQFLGQKLLEAKNDIAYQNEQIKKIEELYEESQNNEQKQKNEINQLIRNEEALRVENNKIEQQLKDLIVENEALKGGMAKSVLFKNKVNPELTIFMLDPVEIKGIKVQKKTRPIKRNNNSKNIMMEILSKPVSLQLVAQIELENPTMHFFIFLFYRSIINTGGRSVEVETIIVAEIKFKKIKEQKTIIQRIPCLMPLQQFNLNIGNFILDKIIKNIEQVTAVVLHGKEKIICKKFCF